MPTSPTKQAKSVSFEFGPPPGHMIDKDVPPGWLV